MQPSDVEVAEGEAAVLNCGPPMGRPEPNVLWKKDGLPINYTDPHYNVRPTLLCLWWYFDVLSLLKLQIHIIKRCQFFSVIKQNHYPLRVLWSLIFIYFYMYSFIFIIRKNVPSLSFIKKYCFYILYITRFLLA